MSELDAKDRQHMEDSDYAFPKERKEPLNDAEHVRNAMARFDQVEGVSDEERDEAWSRIRRRPRSMALKCMRRAGVSSAKRKAEPKLVGLTPDREGRSCCAPHFDPLWAMAGRIRPSRRPFEWARGNSPG